MHITGDNSGITYSAFIRVIYSDIRGLGEHVYSGFSVK